MIRNGHYVTCFPATTVFQQLLSLFIHGIDNACIFIIYNKEFILVMVAFLDEADNIDSASDTRHEFGNDVAFYDMPF